MKMVSAQVVIIGAGLAGASTAYHLTRAGLRDILILEQEDSVGVHASGRSAGLVHRIASDEAIASLVMEGADFIRYPHSDWPIPVEFCQRGSLALGTGKVWEKLKSEADRIQKERGPLQCLTAEEAIAKVSVLEDGDFEGAIFSPLDGVVDVQALLTGYLQAAQNRGARILYSTKVLAVRTQEKRVTAVVMKSQTIKTSVLVNAAGAWASEIGGMGGPVPVPMRSFRRHLFVTDLLPWVKPDWPFVWDFSAQFYFRPESSGLLLSPCDEVEHPPGIPPTDPNAMGLLCEKLERYPRLHNLPIKTAWAGLRTFAADRRFVIGWDPEIRGFFWVAGLGGYGVTASGAIGRLAADLIMNRERKEVKDVSPARFIQP